MSRKFVMARRDLFAAGGAAAMLAAAPALARAAKREPGDAARKFFPDGRVHPFAGNTVLSHLDQQGPQSRPFEVMLDAYRTVPGRSYADKMTLLPPSSYHVTLFGCATDANRAPGQWPRGVPVDASIAECSQIIGDRLRSAEIAPIVPIRMRVDRDDSGYDGNTLRMPLAPVDPAEGERLAAFRNRLADVVGLRSPGHDRYQYHITLGYVVRPFDSVELRDALADMARWKDRLASLCPVIALGAPEYCTFDDMFAFQRQFYL